MCLGAILKVSESGNSRQMPLEQLYTGDAARPISLRPKEILTEIVIPQPTGPCGTGYAKFTMRGGLEFAALSAAASLEMEKGGEICSKARIAVGAVSAMPLRARQAESTLTGGPLSEELLSDFTCSF